MSATHQMIAEAFHAIVANAPDAKRLIARVQVAEYGGGPWSPGLPERDATGQWIVYRDQGWSFTVHLCDKLGNHVRHFLGDGGHLALRFQAIAGSAEKAEELASKFTLERCLRDAREVESFTHENFTDPKFPKGVMVGITYHYGRSLD